MGRDPTSACNVDQHQYVGHPRHKQCRYSLSNMVRMGIYRRLASLLPLFRGNSILHLPQTTRQAMTCAVGSICKTSPDYNLGHAANVPYI